MSRVYLYKDTHMHDTHVHAYVYNIPEEKHPSVVLYVYI